jgi:hypothetical protein
MRLKTAQKRPDYTVTVPSANDGFVWMPYAHECSSKVPWNASINPGLPVYQEPHTHPLRIPDQAPLTGSLVRGEEYVDMRAEPILWATRQAAYAAGLRLLGASRPVDWMPGGER